MNHWRHRRDLDGPRCRPGLPLRLPAPSRGAAAAARPGVVDVKLMWSC